MHAVSQQREVTSPATPPRRAVLRWFDPSEPHMARGPFTRWPRTTDAILTIVVFAASLVTVAASAVSDGENVTIDSIGDRPAAVLDAGGSRRRPAVEAPVSHRCGRWKS